MAREDLEQRPGDRRDLDQENLFAVRVYARRSLYQEPRARKMRADTSGTHVA
jgi:hypothetical protein